MRHPPSTVPAGKDVPAGTAVIFHDHMPHRSDANRGQRSRLALTFHGHASEAEWLPDNWLQREDLPPFAIRSEASS